jgi:hypothetical protein
MAKITYVFSPFKRDDASYLDFLLEYGTISTSGQIFEVVGTANVDTVFVRPGSSYDLRRISGAIDKIYLTGSDSDYTFSGANDILTLTHNITGKTVTVSGSSSNSDRLYFANGFITAGSLYVSARDETEYVLDPSQNSQ